MNPLGSVGQSVERRPRSVNDQEGSKNKNGYEIVSRRNFLKYTGTIIFVVGVN
jgi:hypothetical protein